MDNIAPTPTATDTPTPVPAGGPINAKVMVDFGAFLKETNIAGLAVSFLIAQAVMDTTRAIAGGGIMPLVKSVRTLKAPEFNFNQLVESGIVFTITMFIAFLVIRVAKLKTQQVPFYMPLGRI